MKRALCVAKANVRIYRVITRGTNDAAQGTARPLRERFPLTFVPGTKVEVMSRTTEGILASSTSQYLKKLYSVSHSWGLSYVFGLSATLDANCLLGKSSRC